ncbi:hypothetical protein J2T56_003121 [Natronobacillus azotifigens]|uniref:Uncharacterized protein n=1 Tax=Natronobacillus azotifigens TaxID=472978 RepID=A0A9J6R8Z5_9BACI|nr:hypothetical protein [Natronobacillus azotifigens]MCZ0702023.1 hypothetical protein [Natronobacillus azotifigens]
MSKKTVGISAGLGVALALYCLLVLFIVTVDTVLLAVIALLLIGIGVMATKLLFIRLINDRNAFVFLPFLLTYGVVSFLVLYFIA